MSPEPNVTSVPSEFLSSILVMGVKIFGLQKMGYLEIIGIWMGYGFFKSAVCLG